MGQSDVSAVKAYLEQYRNADFISVFEKFNEGVILTDAEGVILYYNAAMSRIDELKSDEVLHKKITEVYHLTEEKSIIMRCLNSEAPIIDEPIYYRTRMGKFANTIHSAFPLTGDGKVIGAICLVRDYNLLAETLEDMPIPPNLFDNDIFFDSIIGENPEFIKAVEAARMAANTPSPVMLYGETGTGKELFARAIHNHSIRSTSKYTPVNCAAIPENLLEGILFGTSKGAFTGSLDKAGLFERTNGGTLFLDEINSMPVGLQSKILRVLQERKIRRVGALKEIDIDVKIISSVNTNPHHAINDGTLRSDLFYRLGVVFIHIVPLARRIDDIDLLVPHFIAKHNRLLGRRVKRVSEEIMAFFKSYDWPGNVRELEHVIEGAMNIVGSDNVIQMKHLHSHFANRPIRSFVTPVHPPSQNDRFDYSIPPSPSAPNALSPSQRHAHGLPVLMDKKEPSPHKSLIDSRDDQEKKTIHETLSACSGNIARSARQLGISRQLLYYKMKKYHLKRSTYLIT